MRVRSRFILFTTVLGFVSLAACGGTPTAPSAANAFVGTWMNVDPNTRDVTQMQIRLDGGNIYVHAYGACIPTACDWGEASTIAPATNSFTVKFLLGISYTMTVTLSANDGLLHTMVLAHYPDPRPDNTTADTYTKAP